MMLEILQLRYLYNYIIVLQFMSMIYFERTSSSRSGSCH
ncbi:uncharacterized protein METZ01_LOCUS233324, partial [marine metagenome]